MSARKETVSFRGMAKLLVPEEELERGLEEAKRGFTEAGVRMEKMRRACRTMDKLRAKTKGVRFDSVRVIRATRDSR